MTNTWEKTYKKIDQIEGLLVPGQEKVLHDFASRMGKDSVIVEIGSFKGRSTACLGLGARRKGTKIFAIDTFAGNGKDFTRGDQYLEKQYFDQFVNNMKKAGLKNVIPIRGFSHEIGRAWKLPIDLLFIDGSHLYEDVKLDFELFFPYVKPGGLVLFHDVQHEFPGVFKVWNEIAKHKLSHRGCFYTLAYGNKPRNLIQFLRDIYTR